MPTSQVHPDLEAAAQRVKVLSEKVATQAKQNGLPWLEGYEKTLIALLAMEEQAAKAAGAERATVSAEAYGNFVRDTSEIFFALVQRPKG